MVDMGAVEERSERVVPRDADADADPGPNSRDFEGCLREKASSAESRIRLFLSRTRQNRRRSSGEKSFC